MLKVNLLRNSGASRGKATSTEVNFDTNYETSIDSGSSSSGSRDTIIKIALIIGGAASLMIYESFHISELRGRVTEANATQAKLVRELEQKKPIAAKARELQKQIQDIETRIKAIKDLSKVRLREIKAIDYLQNIIPEKLWFSLLEFDGNALKIEGGTTSDDQLNRFLDEMESKSMFKNTILLRAVEQKNKDGTIKIFTINSTVSGVD